MFRFKVMSVYGMRLESLLCRHPGDPVFWHMENQSIYIWLYIYLVLILESDVSFIYIVSFCQYQTMLITVDYGKSFKIV